MTTTAPATHTVDITKRSGRCMVVLHSNRDGSASDSFQLPSHIDLAEVVAIVRDNGWAIGDAVRQGPGHWTAAASRRPS